MLEIWYAQKDFSDCESSLRNSSGYKITPKVASVNTSKLSQTQNDLRYEVFHDMFLPTSRIKSEAENRKPEN